MPEHPHRRSGGRPGRRVALGAAVVLLLVLAWAGFQGWRGARELQAAAGTLTAARADLGDGERARAQLDRAGQQTAAARRHLTDPVLRAFAAVPRLGDPLDTAAGLARAADTTVHGALLRLVTAAGAEPGARLTAGPGTVDVDYLASRAAPARQAEQALQRAAATVAATPASSGVGRVDAARADFSDQLRELQQVVADVALALDVAPSLLGQTGTQRYLVLSQSPAEARGTGGLLGGYTLLEVTDGAVSVVRSGARTDLESPGEPVVDLGAEFDDHYGANGARNGWINSNLSPHLPYAARIWTALWERQFPEPLDGVVLLDPVALSYLMPATGPVTLTGGEVVTADDVVDLTLKDVYARFPAPSQDPQRDALLQEVSTGVAATLTSAEPDGRALAQGLSRAVAERRLLFWSADQQVQARLAGTAISGTLPTGPAVGDVIVDAAGSKLDYYLERDLRYTSGCGTGASRLALTLTNTAPTSGLPAYVTPEPLRAGRPEGTNLVLATLYVPPASVVTGLTLDGRDVSYGQGTELGLVWLEAQVVLEPGQSAELVATFVEPAGSDGQVERIAQPLVREETFTATGC